MSLELAAACCSCRPKSVPACAVLARSPTTADGSYNVFTKKSGSLLRQGSACLLGMSNIYLHIAKCTMHGARYTKCYNLAGLARIYAHAGRYDVQQKI